MHVSTPIPNVFLIGAPKSGTTAMVEYLRDHPYAYFSVPKEPHFWATDLPGLRKQVEVEDEDTYRNLFARCSPKHRVIGDGSTLYLMSDHAIEKILAFNPEAKFVAMLRHPVDLAYSFHRQLVRTLNEDVRDFEEAWALQEKRRKRQALPSRCVERRLLQYRDVAQIGRQVDQMMEIVPPAQRHLIFFDDFCDDPSGVYRGLLNFLGLPDDDRQDFPRHNEAAAYRSRLLGQMVETPFVRRLFKGIKRRLSGNLLTAMRHTKDAVLSKPVEKQPMRATFSNRLIDDFADDIALLARRTDRCLNHWLQHRA